MGGYTKFAAWLRQESRTALMRRKSCVNRLDETEGTLLIR